MDMDEVIAIMLLVIVIALAYAYSQPPKPVVVKPITWQEIVIDAKTKTFLLQMQ